MLKLNFYRLQILRYIGYTRTHKTVLSCPQIWLADKSVIYKRYRNSNRFTVCITLLAVFLKAASVKKYIKHIQYIYIKNLNRVITTHTLFWIVLYNIVYQLFSINQYYLLIICLLYLLNIHRIVATHTVYGK